MSPRRIIVGISGASGAIYGYRALARLRTIDEPVEIHLVISPAGERTIATELDVSVAAVRDLADVNHANRDIGAAIASGSFATMGMLVAPCSVNTMSAVAGSLANTLLVRAADVVLKERRRLVLLVRETHFHLGHFRTMVALTEMGAIVAPPLPGFYDRPQTIMDLVDHSVDRALTLFGFDVPGSRPWTGGLGERPSRFADASNGQSDISALVNVRNPVCVVNEGAPKL